MLAVLREDEGEVHISLAIENTKTNNFHILFEDKRNFTRIAMYDLNLELDGEGELKNHMCLICSTSTGKDLNIDQMYPVDYLITSHDVVENHPQILGTWKQSEFEMVPFGDRMLIFPKDAKKNNPVLEKMLDLVDQKMKELKKHKSKGEDKK
jgi:hypothetical protein